MHPITFLVAALAVAPLTGVTAQEPPPVKVGDRVRITAPTLDIDKYDGTLRAMDRDTLIVDSLRVALLSVTRLDVHRGRKSHAVKGGLIGGFSSGLITGTIVATYCALGASDPGPFILSCSESPGYVVIIATGFGIGFAGGALVGGVIGALIKTDRWEEVPLDRLRVIFVPQRDGRFGLGLSVRF